MTFVQFMYLLGICAMLAFGLFLIIMWIILDSRGYFDDMY